jgi:hypothetical protein
MYMTFEFPRYHKPKQAASIWKARVEAELYTMMKAGDRIGLESVSRRLNCGVSNLWYYGLTKIIVEASKQQSEMFRQNELASLKAKVNNLFTQFEQRRSVATYKAVQENLGISQLTMRYKDPSLFQWIQEQLPLHRERVRLLEIEDLKEMARPIIKELQMIYGRAHIYKVVERLEIPYNTFCRRYPELVDFIKQSNLRV